MRVWRGKRGFTLQEMAVTIVILGILVAIAIIIILALLEQWRVNVATDQLVADFRLAHTRSTNQLTDWRVVLLLNQPDEDVGPDYYLVKLEAPYPTVAPKPVERIPRTFPANVVTKIPVTASGMAIKDDQTDPFWAEPWPVTPGMIPETRTFEFNSDGTTKVYGAASASTCVTIDNAPNNRVFATAATSRIRIGPDGCDGHF